MDRCAARTQTDDDAQPGERSDADPACPPSGKGRLAQTANLDADQPSVSLDDACAALTPAQRRWLMEHGQRAIDAAIRRADCGANISPAIMRTGETFVPPAAGAGASVRVRVVSAAEMGRLHERALGDPSPTDVLTFDMRDAPGGVLDADIVVCADIARDEAAARDSAVERELLLYILHGALHCLGFDDHAPGDADRMRAAQEAILEAVGADARLEASRRPREAAGA